MFLIHFFCDERISIELESFIFRILISNFLLFFVLFLYSTTHLTLCSFRTGIDADLWDLKSTTRADKSKLRQFFAPL